MIIAFFVIGLLWVIAGGGWLIWSLVAPKSMSEMLKSIDATAPWFSHAGIGSTRLLSTLMLIGGIFFLALKFFE